MQRLEQAVTRLEQMSVMKQPSSSVANGSCVNGIDGGECAIENVWDFKYSQSYSVPEFKRVNNLGLLCLFPGPSQSLEVFDVLLKGPVSDYLNYSRAIGSEVETHVSPLMRRKLSQ